MPRKLIAVCDDELFMFVDEKTEEVDIRDRCVVYNQTTNLFVPDICIGSWTARVFPWEDPTEEQIKESLEIMERIEAYERNEN